VSEQKKKQHELLPTCRLSIPTVIQQPAPVSLNSFPLYGGAILSRVIRTRAVIDAKRRPCSPSIRPDGVVNAPHVFNAPSEKCTRPKHTPRLCGARSVEPLPRYRVAETATWEISDIPAGEASSGRLWRNSRASRASSTSSCESRSDRIQMDDVAQ
jgi:hypothetical protein